MEERNACSLQSRNKSGLFLCAFYTSIGTECRFSSSMHFGGTWERRDGAKEGTGLRLGLCCRLMPPTNKCLTLFAFFAGISGCARAQAIIEEHIRAVFARRLHPLGCGRLAVAGYLAGAPVRRKQVYENYQSKSYPLYTFKVLLYIMTSGI